jgi:hypothetical protein
MAAYAAKNPAASAAQLSLLDARQWLNTAPLQAADLRGKVVLVNFWDLFLHQQPSRTALCPGLGG